MPVAYLSMIATAATSELEASLRYRRVSSEYKDILSTKGPTIRPPIRQAIYIYGRLTPDSAMHQLMDLEGERLVQEGFCQIVEG